MFSSRQIISASKLIKNFRLLANQLANEPQALLVTQKSKDPLVLVNAAIFEDLLEFQRMAFESGFMPQVAWEEQREL